MKLLLCCKCSQIFSLSHTYTECKGGHGGGRYIDNIKAEIVGDKDTIMVLGFTNQSFIGALSAQRKEGDRTDSTLGRDFTAFIMPENAPNVIRIPAKQ